MIDMTNIMTLDEVSACVFVDQSTVKRWVYRGVLPAQKFGNKLMFDRRDVMALDVDAIMKPGRKKRNEQRQPMQEFRSTF